MMRLSTFACVAVASAFQPSSTATFGRTRQLNSYMEEQQSPFPAAMPLGGVSGFTASVGKCVGQGSAVAVNSIEEAVQYATADPATYPAYLVHKTDGGANAWLCGANYGQEIFDAGPEWTVFSFGALPAPAYTPAVPGPADVQGALEDSGSRTAALELDFDRYCQFMQDNQPPGARLSQEELKAKYDELNAEYSSTTDDYDEFINNKQGVASSNFRRGGAYNFYGQQDKVLTPLVQFLKWQEWYISYCKLRGIGQHAYK